MGRDDLVASVAYQPEPTAAAAARRFVRETLEAWLPTGGGAGGHGLIDDAVLLTSELVTNAVVHAGTPVQVTCRLANGDVEVAVSDCYPAAMVPNTAEGKHGAAEGEHGAAERTSGRGLLLPAALASAWGVTYGRSAKAVWFRLGAATAVGAAGGEDGPGEGLGANPVGEFGAEMGGGAALAAAFRSAVGTSGVAQHEKDVSRTNGHRAGRGYQQLAVAAAESARAAVGADGVCVLLADEDGDLRPQAAVGSMRAPTESTAAPSVLTVPFMVDGRVTGLLAAVSAQPGSFGAVAAVTLQRLADSWGPQLQRAWLDELERVRRDRIAALSDTRALLRGDMRREEIMARACRAVVPRLAPWCAVLLPGAAGRPRPAHVCHHDGTRTESLARLIDGACEAAAPGAAQRDDGPGWRWRLGGTASPPEVAWCFPVGQQLDGQGLLLLGTERGGRLSREVGTLAADLACRVGLALERARAATGGWDAGG